MSGVTSLAFSFTLYVTFLCWSFSAGQQPITTRCSIWTRVPLSDLGVKFLGHKAEFHNSSLLSCAAYCNSHPPCLSFSIHREDARCFLFADRVLFGLQMQRQLGYQHYWRLNNECPSTLDYVYDENGHVCYKPQSSSIDHLPWRNASLVCQQDGGHLYIANSYAKMQVLTNYLETNGYQTSQFKLGGNDFFEEGWFLWLDGSPVSTWYSDQPDNRNGNQHCLENTRNHPTFTSDGICDTSDRYICQIPLQ